MDTTGWKKEYLRYKTYFLNMSERYRERADIRAYLEILLSLITVTVFSVFALRPTILTIAELIREIDTKKETLQKMENKIENISKAQSLQAQNRAQINLLADSVPIEPRPEVFARQVEGISFTNQVALEGINEGEAVILGKETQQNSQSRTTLTPMPEGSNSLTFSVKSESTLEGYQLFSNLLSELENLRRPSKIDFAKLSVVGEGDEKTLFLVVEGRLPYFTDSDENSDTNQNLNQ